MPVSRPTITPTQGNQPLGLNTIKEKVRVCLNRLYTEDGELFNKPGRGVAERCLVFRLAHYLQEEFDDYFVDCDYNFSSRIIGGHILEVPGKETVNRQGDKKKIFPDIIIHKRGSRRTQITPDYILFGNLICFEVKKWNNTRNGAGEEDEHRVKYLTTKFAYLYGFYIVLGKTKDATTWTVYEKTQGDPTVTREMTFEQQRVDNAVAATGGSA